MTRILPSLLLLLPHSFFSSLSGPQHPSKKWEAKTEPFKTPPSCLWVLSEGGREPPHVNLKGSSAGPQERQAGRQAGDNSLYPPPRLVSRPKLWSLWGECIMGPLIRSTRFKASLQRERAARQWAYGEITAMICVNVTCILQR